MAAAVEMASDIAGKSPVAVQGTKVNLNYVRDHSVQDGLDFVVRLEAEIVCDFHSNWHLFSAGRVEQLLSAERRRGQGRDGGDGQGEGRVLQTLGSEKRQKKYIFI